MSPRCKSIGTCLPVAVLVALAAAFSAPGQDPSRYAQQPGSDTASPSQEKDKQAANATDAAAKKSTAEPEFVQKTDLEWRKILTRSQFMVTRMKATEPAFSGKYASGHFRGTFLCVCCGAELFGAQHKFESGTGWPSFWRPINERALTTAPDNSEAEPRTEVMCRRCGAHLGHVFDDGPLPTGLRFCINSVALKLRPPGGTAADNTATKSKAKTKAKAKSKAKANGNGPAQPSAEQ